MLNTIHQNTVKARPAGTTAAVATVAVLVLNQLGVNIAADAAAGIIGALTTIVSIVKPIAKELGV